MVSSDKGKLSPLRKISLYILHFRHVIFIKTLYELNKILWKWIKGILWQYVGCCYNTLISYFYRAAKNINFYSLLLINVYPYCCTENKILMRAIIRIQKCVIFFIFCVQIKKFWVFSGIIFCGSVFKNYY